MLDSSNNSAVKIEVQPEPAEPVTGGGGGGGGILQQWSREDLIKRGSLGLRGLALFFSLISLILVASNKHGGWADFDKYPQYRYLLAIAILSCFYTGGQVHLGVHELSTGRKMLQPRIAVLFDFIGDQIMAYLLISSASSAIPITDTIREGGDNIFTDSSSSAISMSFLAFICLALSAIISGHKLSAQTCI
ncbi:CASP-like protein 4B1 [Lotus japonicus]|uniref:CASP-like protein n=1 Tax=Lotus japonicus TaxID=34305 RepID=I3S7L6_LOTJA|nr:CASP-like protein 4B1 [Lotus japonicus]AFK36258.1 unknown [Lotus japonicus]